MVGKAIGLMLWIESTFLILVPSTILTADLSNCRKSLGMQSGAIPDHAITASSSYDVNNVGPTNARIRIEKNGGAWCPKPPIARNVFEWIEIDLQELKVVTQIETQGRFGNGQGQEYAEQYLVEYKRVEGGPYIRFKDRRGVELFAGNSNTYIAELKEINPPIIARWVRLVPYSVHPRTVCLRLELYGCVWRDGLLSYTMPQGERRGTELDLSDLTYDGKLENGWLTGGLGQLTDGAEGHSNFRLDTDGHGRKGYEWVGWKNDTIMSLMSSATSSLSEVGAARSEPVVSILFEFDRPRNFSSVRFHCNNMFSKEVRVFRKAIIHFSLDGVFRDSVAKSNGGSGGSNHGLFDASSIRRPRRHDRNYGYKLASTHSHHHHHHHQHHHRSLLATTQGDLTYALQYPPVTFEFMRDTLIDFARNVIVTIPGRVARFVRVDLLFDARWLMVSEVRFESELVSENLTEFFANSSTFKQDDDDSESSSSSSSSSTSSSSSYWSDQLIGVIIGAVGIPLLIVVVIFILCFFCRWKKKCSSEKLADEDPKLTLHLGDGIPLKKMEKNGHYYTYNNTIFHHQTSTSGRYSTSVPQVTQCVATLKKSEDATVAAGVVGDLFFGGLSPVQRELPDIPLLPYESTDYLSDTNTSTYAVPDNYRIAPPSALSSSTNQLQGQIRSSDLDLVSDQSSTNYRSRNWVGSRIGSALDVHWDLGTLGVNEFRQNQLRLVEKLGEGLFGEVHLCEVSLNGRTSKDKRINSRKIVGAVKILSANASLKMKDNFLQEVQIMARLRDPNIVSILGACLGEEPWFAVVDYPFRGDLNQYLRAHSYLDASSYLTTQQSQNFKLLETKTLSYGALIYMATQIASGMKYLETMKVVHRDLATRNCLVGRYLQVKISDLGMTSSLYKVDYYRVQGQAVLPVRWMAWESVLLGKFSSKSDVWSFGVTLWEVMNFARSRPFEGMDDQQVIDSYARCLQMGQLITTLPQPISCPREIYDLMRECWNREEEKRPTFSEIHMFLSRKNLGYKPSDDITEDDDDDDGEDDEEEDGDEDEEEDEEETHTEEGNITSNDKSDVGVKSVGRDFESESKSILV